MSQDIELGLLPCPFCGSTDVEFDDEDASIYCNSCPGMVRDLLMSAEALYSAWNTRATKMCRYCDKPLVRWERESKKNFAARQTCNHTCASLLRQAIKRGK